MQHTEHTSPSTRTFHFKQKLVKNTFNEIDTLLEETYSHTDGNEDLKKILNEVKMKMDSLKQQSASDSLNILNQNPPKHTTNSHSQNLLSSTNDLESGIEEFEDH